MHWIWAIFIIKTLTWIKYRHLGGQIPLLFTTFWGNSPPAEIGRYKLPVFFSSHLCARLWDFINARLALLSIITLRNGTSEVAKDQNNNHNNNNNNHDHNQETEKRWDLCKSQAPPATASPQFSHTTSFTCPFVFLIDASLLCNPGRKCSHSDLVEMFG